MTRTRSTSASSARHDSCPRPVRDQVIRRQGARNSTSPGVSTELARISYLEGYSAGLVTIYIRKCMSLLGVSPRAAARLLQEYGLP